MGIALLSCLWIVTFPGTVANQYTGILGLNYRSLMLVTLPMQYDFANKNTNKNKNQPIQQNIPFFVCPCFVSQPKSRTVDGSEILHHSIGKKIHPILYRCFFVTSQVVVGDFFHQQMVVKSHLGSSQTALVGGKASACPPVR